MKMKTPTDDDAGGQLANKTAVEGRLRRLVGPWVELHVACNHPNTGGFIGLANGLEIDAGDHRTLSFNLAGTAPLFSVDAEDHHVVLCAVRLQYKRYAQHVGSWVWDAWAVRTEDVERLLRSARFQRAFEADGGEESMWELWESIRPNAWGDTPGATEPKSK